MQYKITNVKFYIVEVTTPYKITNIKFYIVEIITTSFKRTNIKFYIVEPTTPLENQLQCRLSHLNRKLFLSRPHKPEGLKEILKHPKSPQPDIAVGKSTGQNNKSKHYKKITKKLLHYRTTN